MNRFDFRLRSGLRQQGAAVGMTIAEFVSDLVTN
jgi:hypothetical protein